MKARLLDFLGKRFERIESFSFLILVSSLVLSSMGVESADPLVLLAAGVLAINYYFFALQPIQADSYKALSLFAHKMTYVGLSVAVLAVLFTMKAWEGARPMTVIAIGSLLISNVLPFIQKAISSSEQRYDTRHYVRCIGWLLALIYLKVFLL